MSHHLYTKILVDRVKFYKLLEIEKQMKLINEEKKNQLKIVPSSNSISENIEQNKEKNVEQSGSGELKTQQTSLDSFLTDQLIQKISAAVTQNLRQTLKQNIFSIIITTKGSNVKIIIL